MKDLWVVVLAAGEGKRMHSRLPKVLHPICGKPMIHYILKSASALTGDIVIVVGHEAAQVRAACGEDYRYVYQEEQLGTGHALMQAMGELPSEGLLFVLCGDTPLFEAAHLQDLATLCDGHDALVATTTLSDPGGYGRVVRDERGRIARIVEERDATGEEKAIREINTGTYCFDIKLLRKYLPRLNSDNAQGEYYLPDVLHMFYRDRYSTGAYVIKDYRVGLGINNRLQLADAAAIIGKRFTDQLMLAGVTIVDPGATYLDLDTKIEAGAVIYPGCYIERGSVIGAGCMIGPNTHLSGAVIEDGATVRHCVVENSVVKSGRQVGPYAHIKQTL